MEREQRLVMAERICWLLLSKSTSYADLAREAGVTAEAARRYAIGEREPRGPLLLNIAKALGTTTDYLLGRVDDPDWKPDYAAMDIDERVKTSVPMDRETKRILFGDLRQESF